MPGATSVADAPFTVQALTVSELKMTGRPDVADATRASGAPSVWLGGAANVIVCADAVIENDWLTSGAGSYVASPGCVARTEQTPRATSVTVVPEMLHVAGESDVNETGSPDVAAALSASVPVAN